MAWPLSSVTFPVKLVETMRLSSEQIGNLLRPLNPFPHPPSISSTSGVSVLGSSRLGGIGSIVPSSGTFFLILPLASPCSQGPTFLWSGRREEFFTKTTCETLLASGFQARYKEVHSAGKRRPLLIFDENVDLLAPLHVCLYDHLRRFDWLLCGPPTEERMTSVCVNAYQTSVDLVAATDGLSHDVAQTILDLAFFTSVEIPRSLRALAKRSLEPSFVGLGGKPVSIKHGQMMGSYLSFPLLCLQSYCAATWAARFDTAATFLVNGDDAVISASRGITVQDYPPRMRLNSDKTIVAENVVEVNSTCFLRSSGRWREIRNLRRGGAVADYPGMLHMAQAVCVSQGFQDAFQRARIGRRWGFLPSQLGHFGVPAYKRERQLRRTRNSTRLPDCGLSQDETGLRRIVGRRPTDLESEALRSFLWAGGRKGGLKRDVFSPSCGKIRRTYSYRGPNNPCRSFLSFVGFGRRRKLCAARAKPASFFLVPDEFETVEEELGELLLERWRAAVPLV